MRLIERDHCVVNGEHDLEPLHCFHDFPVFMGCVTQPNEEDQKADMDWWISRGTGLIQLKSLIPLDVLYAESHGSGCVGRLWDMHHRAFAEYVSRGQPSAVIEIGGAHGLLAREYQRIRRIPWTIIEPNPAPVDGCDAKFIGGFFDESFRYNEAFDTVVHSHVFEHMFEPDAFMGHLARFMAEGKRLVFSLPNMQIMLERKYTNCINFEHTIFLSEPYVEFLLAKHGFRILQREYFMADHSIFYSALRDSMAVPAPLSADLYTRNRALYLSYIEYHETLVESLNREIDRLDRRVYLFGAHVFAQYLIAFGLDTSRITCLLDNDRKKQGKRLYGTDLLVRSPNVLKGEKEPLVILKAGVYNQEVKVDILENVNSSVRFLE